MNHPLPEQPLVQESLPNRPPFLNTKRMVFWFVSICVFVLLIGVSFFPAVRTSREGARRAQCLNNLQNISRAIRDYTDQNGQPPPLWTTNDRGQRLHSWRTLLLPYLDQNELFKQIDLSKPWDHPVHDAIRQTTPRCYACPSALVEPGTTNYVANTTGELLLTDGHPTPIFDSIPRISQVDSGQIAIFETDRSRHLEWMSPADFDFAEYAEWILDGNYLRDPHIVINCILINGEVTPVETRSQ